MILIVDDDPSVTTSLSLLLKQNGYPSAVAETPDRALELVAGQEFRLVLQDMNFSRETTGREGLELLARLREARPEMPVILITAWGSISLAVEGMRAGAADFITKPWNNASLLRSVETTLSLAGASSESRSPAPRREDLDRSHDFGGLVGQEPHFLRVLETIGRVAATDASVLITGESGTGKEMVAEAVHRNSKRAGGAFVKVNLGGISSTLFESEMFGHVRGAFTDARTRRAGRFECADGGSIFLDEIGELDPNSQVKLLRVLQDRTYEMLGSSTPRTVDVRVISATNQDLARLVSTGGFREDLLYRLNLISIRLPSLRERKGDIPRLARHFFERYAEIYGRPGLALEDAAIVWLERQSWPGNVRQLKQTLERAVLMLDGNRLSAKELDILSELESRDARQPALPSPGSMTLDQIEKAMILKCMHHYDRNITHVADALGLSRAALYRRFQKYGLDPNRG